MTTMFVCNLPIVIKSGSPSGTGSHRQEKQGTLFPSLPWALAT